MQDIDFEALDNAVTKIMDEKKATAERRQRIEKQRRVGRNMDVINVAHAKSARPLVKPSAIKKTITAPKQSAKMQDVRPKASTKPVSRPQPVIIPKKPVVKPAAKEASAKVTASASQARGSELIRQRRRLHSATPVVPAVKPSGQEFAIARGNSVVKGHYQTETLSTKQPDGSETVYQHSEVDYVAQISPEVANNQLKPLSQYNFAKLEAEPVIAATQSAKVAPARMVSLDEQATAKPVVKAASATPQPKILHQSDLQKERTQSPFIETVKVDKRPLGAPYDKSAQATLKVEQQDVAKEAVLYRDDLRTEEQPSKLSSVIWIILTIVAIIGAAAGIYLLTVYNK